MKIYLVSLGCSKNLVDSEMILGAIENGQIVTDANGADLMIVNTCGFIEAAKEEAIKTILDLADIKKGNQKLVVVGCLAQRYKKELESSMPEVDRFLAISEYNKLGEILNALTNEHAFTDTINPLKRVLSTGNKSVYVKISEGCNNRCAYCAIPLIRGNLQSRTIESIYEEVLELVKSGAKEINLISQDTTNYGFDLYKKPAIIPLLEKLLTIKDIKWIRMLYLYPTLVTDEFISFIKNNPKVLPYFDIPVQHSETRVLKSMLRRGTKEEYLAMFKKIRQEIPNSVLRTTMIVGFPTETEEEFNDLIEFVKEVQFDRLGAFPYSKEEDTKAYEYEDQIPEKIKNQRYSELMEVQKWISLAQNKKHLNQIEEVFIEGYDEEMLMYYGRSYAHAPDDIDGCIYVAALEELQVGQIIKAKIVDCDFYTLTAEQVLE